MKQLKPLYFIALCILFQSCSNYKSVEYNDIRNNEEQKDSFNPDPSKYILKSEIVPPVCPKCPEPPDIGKCPEPERCPPSKDCPKCYGVKYIKVPVVKSEPPKKPQRRTIFPENLIDTKLIREVEKGEIVYI